MTDSNSALDTFFYKSKSYILKFKIELISSFLCGLFAYGFYFTNTIYNHDSISTLSDEGGTYELGRWGRDVISWILPHVTMPWFDGILSLIIFSIAICLISDIFEIKNRLYKFLLAGIIICFPSITSDYFYIYQCVDISISFLFAVLCVFYCKKALLFDVYETKTNWKHCGCAVISLVLSICIYQALLAVTTSLFVAYLIQKIIQNWAGRRILKMIIALLNVLGISIIVYFSLTLLILFVIDAEFGSYAEKQTNTDAPLYLRCLFPYYFFLRELIINHGGIVTSRVSTIAHIVILSLFFILGYKKVRLFSLRRKTALVLLILIYPLSINFLYLVIQPRAVYTLPLIGFLSLYIICVIGIEEWKNRNWQGDLLKILLIIILFSNIRTANILAMRIHTMYENAYSFYTTLVTQIKGSGMLDENSKLAICGTADNYVHKVDDIPQRGFFPLTLLIQANHRYEFIKYFIGFDIKTVSLEEKKEIVQTDEFKSMSIYPYNGSINKIGDVIVVKFSEEVNDSY